MYAASYEEHEEHKPNHEVVNFRDVARVFALVLVVLIIVIPEILGSNSISLVTSPVAVVVEAQKDGLHRLPL